MKKVLVAGATGYLGQHIVKSLKAQGYWVRVLIRHEEQKAIFEAVDDYFIGEITKMTTLTGLMDEIDWVMTTVGITRQKEGLTYMDVDYQGNFNLLKVALNGKVEKFLYVSAINGEKMRHLKIFEAKEKFVDILKASPIKHSIIRPNGFFSDMSDFLTMAQKGTVYLFGNGEYKLNPIHGADLALACIECLTNDIDELTIGGPDLFTQNQLAELALKAWQRPIKIKHLPDWIRRLTIWVLRTFTSSKTYGPYEFFLTAMSFDNIANPYGNRKLEDFFKQKVSEIQHHE